MEESEVQEARHHAGRRGPEGKRQAQDREGELTPEVQDSRYADALYSFIQGLIRVESVAHVFTEKTKSRRAGSPGSTRKPARV